jgi:hypothetical protein
MAAGRQAKGTTNVPTFDEIRRKRAELYSSIHDLHFKFKSDEMGKISGTHIWNKISCKKRQQTMYEARKTLKNQKISRQKLRENLKKYLKTFLFEKVRKQHIKIKIKIYICLVMKAEEWQHVNICFAAFYRDTRMQLAQHERSPTQYLPTVYVQLDFNAASFADCSRQGLAVLFYRDGPSAYTRTGTQLTRSTTECVSQNQLHNNDHSVDVDLVGGDAV